MSLISLHLFVVTQLARKELLLTYLSPTDLSPSVAEDKSFSLCCCQCLVLLSTDLISFVCFPIPFSASRGFSKCSWILTSWTWMGNWTSSVDPRLPESSQGFPILMTWPDPSSPPQVSGLSRRPPSHHEPHLQKPNTSNTQIVLFSEIPCQLCLHANERLWPPLKTVHLPLKKKKKSLFSPLLLSNALPVKWDIHYEYGCL